MERKITFTLSDDQQAALEKSRLAENPDASIEDFVDAKLLDAGNSKVIDITNAWNSRAVQDIRDKISAKSDKLTADDVAAIAAIVDAK